MRYVAVVCFFMGVAFVRLIVFVCCCFCFFVVVFYFLFFFCFVCICCCFSGMLLCCFRVWLLVILFSSGECVKFY